MRPILFSIGSINVYSHGTMMGIAFMVGILLLMKRAERRNISPDEMLNAGIVVLISSIIGSRLLFVLDHASEFIRRPSEIVMIQRGGLAFYGGFIGGYLGCVAYLRLKRLPMWKVGDLIAVSVILGLGIGRIGCFLNADDFGTPTDLPWGISFPPGSFAYQIVGDQRLHPTQLYEMAVAFVLAGGLAFMERRKRFDGQVFWSLVILYGAARFIIEFFRGDMVVRGYIGSPFWNNARIISVVSSAIAVYMMVKLSRVKMVPQRAASRDGGKQAASQKGRRERKRRK